MYSPHKFAGRIGNIGSPLPDPFNSLAIHKIQFRRGATSMIAGAPGSFKSVFALNMLAEWSRHGVGGMYFSADSEEFTVIKRLSGILTGDDIDRIEQRILRGDRRKYESELKRLKGVEFEYRQMDMQGLATHIKQYEAIYGEYPDVVYVDNLIDFVDSPDDWGGMLVMTRELDALAREIKSHICILHHAKLRMDGGGKSQAFGRPPADWEIQGKVTQIPRLVLTMAAENLSLKVACVKNTNGPQSRDASFSIDFQVHSSMQVRDVSFTMGRT
jgi:AAA domain